MSRLLVVALASCLAFPAAALDKPTADTVIATVNGEDITLGHLLLFGENAPPDYWGFGDEQLYDVLLGQLIRQTVLSQRMENDRRAAFGVENVVRAYRAEVVLVREVEARVTEEAVRAAFEAEVAELGEVVEWNASHILVETEEEARALKVELEGGADFAKLAMEKSTGPSGSRGGALGWFRGGAMVPTFQAAVETMNVGEISEPVETRFGWHVIKINETRMAPAIVFEEVEDRIRDALVNETILSAVDEAVADADISRVEEIDPSVVSNADLLTE